MPERSYRALLWGLALVGLAADQATKYGVFAWLKPAPESATNEELKHRAFAVFQTKPESTSFAILPRTESSRDGFFLAPEFKTDPPGSWDYVHDDSWRYR